MSHLRGWELFRIWFPALSRGANFFRAPGARWKERLANLKSGHYTGFGKRRPPRKAGATKMRGGACGETWGETRLYHRGWRSYTFNVRIIFQSARKTCFLWCVLAGTLTLAQEPAAKPESNSPPNGKTSAAKNEEKAVLPFQIQLLETHIRFEANGDSRKEVHTIVKINEIAGARQFSRLGFDYNRAFQKVEIPEMKITHANGGTSEILPSAITDAPNSAVEKFPAYQDVRVKSVRILGLQDGDTLEYRVITTTTKPPLAPDFWYEHSFDHSGTVLHEELTVERPPGQSYLNYGSEKPTEQTATPEGGTVYVWKIEGKPAKDSEDNAESQTPDITAGSFATEMELIEKLHKPFYEKDEVTTAVKEKTAKLTAGMDTDDARLEAVYRFVSQKVATVDLPVGATGFHLRSPEEVLAGGAGTQEDKARLLIAMTATFANFTPVACFTLRDNPSPPYYSLPAHFQHLLIRVSNGVRGEEMWMDPAAEVAPFGMVSGAYRGKEVLCITADYEEHDGLGEWDTVSTKLPFAARQSVGIEATLDRLGRLSAKVKYVMRGDNELVLREAFHQTPKERWKDVAGLLALSDGFRGEITNVTAADPMETEKPFTVEYEIVQPKFVDWTKKPVRIPALLPQIALPDAPGKAGEKIELGTPLEVETRLTLRLPAGTTVETPPGTSVTRDYATYSSKYDGHLNTLVASRHVHFLMREIPRERAADYGAFVRAVQIDQAQAITLFAPETMEKK